MKQRLKSLFFRLLGKDPEAVVVSFASGDPEKVRAMVAEVRKLLPGRRHFLVADSPFAIAGVETIPFAGHRRRLRGFRIGMAPVLFDETPSPLRRAAFFLAPAKILAYNSRLERHHLHWKSPLASWLFFRGIPLDRIHLRPLCWFTYDRTVVPNDPLVIEGRPPRTNRRRVGVLTPFTPYPPSHGGAVRLFNLLREMARDFDVYLFAFREKENPQDLQPLLEFCTAIAMVSKPRYREPRWSTLLPPEVNEYESRPMRALIATLRRERLIEVLQVEFTQLASYPGDILVEHDVTFDLYAQIHARDRTVASWWNWWRWWRFESRAVRRFRRVVTMSEKDTRLLDIRHGAVIANGVDLARFAPAPEQDGQHLLFIGSFRHFPNVTAFRFLAEEVWPLLKERCPSMRVSVIAGPDPGLYWQGRLPERIELHGFIADVRPFYREANIVLVPTLFSAGTNLKVLEAMAMRRAIVSTSSGIGGIDAVPEEHVLVADGAEAFAKAIGRLAGDPVLRARLAANARSFVEQRYDWGKLGDRQKAMIEQVLPERLLIREGRSSDVVAVRTIQSEALPSSRWDAEHYLRHEFFVALWDGELAGFIVARKTAPDEREILNIAVKPDHRKKGLGEKLLKALIESGEPGEVFLEVRESNEDARRLYERIGFVNVGKRPGYYDNPPETAVIMRIRVPAAAAR